MDALFQDLDHLFSSGVSAYMSQDKTSVTSTSSEPQIHVVGAGVPSIFKHTFKKYTTNKVSINYFIYIYKSATEEATDWQKFKHLPSCLRRIA